MTRVVLDDASDRAAAADPRFNVTLEASAGTGKTRVLVTRYIRLVEEGADPRHILAITFTRKAVGEMKSRIISELRARRSLWKEIRERLFEIHIATIDAFCLGLLREFPLEAGLDPDVELLDEVDIEQLAEQAVDGALAGPFPSRSPDISFLLSVFGEGALRRGCRDFLRARLVKDEILTRFVRRTIPRDLSIPEVLKTAAAGLKDVLGGSEAIEEFLACGPGSTRSEWRALSFALRRATTPVLATVQDIEQTADYFLTQKGRPRKRLASLFTQVDFPDRAQYEKHRDLVLARAPQVAAVHRRWSDTRNRYAVRELWKLYQGVLRRFNDLKESRHGVDFTDVLLDAVGLLRQQGDFSQSRYRLESRYHHLLIDEFQDTNTAQWSLIQELIRSWGEGAGLVQDTILAEQAAGRGTGLLREPSIFIVGDRKQSIYGWRDARVEVMETAARKITRLRPGGGKRLHIRRSFRARGELLAFLNDVFSQMPVAKEKLPWTFRYGKIDHFPVSVSEEKQSEHPVGLSVAFDRSRAAAAVADEIVRLLEEENYRPKDIAILFRSRTHYRAYEEALVDRGVPTYVYRGLGFFDSPEVRDLQALVRYLAEPGSDLRAAELARSRFIMVSDTGLALLAQTRRKRDSEGLLTKLLRGAKHVDPLPEHLSAHDRAVLTRFTETVPKWLDKVDRLPPADLLQQILDESDYPAWFADPRVSRQGWENLKKILEMVRRAQNRGYMTLSRLADYLDRASSGEESLAVLEAVDAVNLMTIHAAKGLEFDAVFVVNLDQKTRSDTSLPKILEKSSGEEERVEVHALGRPVVEGPDRAVEEEKRLLYVALTRARRNLVLCAVRSSETEGEATLLQLLPKSLRVTIDAALTTTETELPWGPKYKPHRIRIIRPDAETREYHRIDETPRLRMALAPLPNTSPTRLSVGAFVREQTGEGFDPWALEPLDLAVGRGVHRMFEHAVSADEDVERVAEALIPETPGRTPSERRAVAARAADFYRKLQHQPELAHLLENGRIYREVPFSLVRQGRVIRGAIDALVSLPGEVVVIDYKTGTARREHRMQMELYLEAARALFPEHKLQGVVFYPNRDPVRIGPPPAEDGPTSQLKLF